MIVICTKCDYQNRSGVLYCTQCGVQISNQPQLLVLYGPDRGEMLTIESREMTVGRDAGNDIVLHDPAVSSRHASLYYEDEVLSIEDKQSRNGTQVNGERIASRCDLRNEYLVKLGNTLLRVRIPSLIASRSRELPVYAQLPSRALDK